MILTGTNYCSYSLSVLSNVATDVDSQENSIREKSLSGLLYAERVNSFENAWPYKKKTDPCNVHNVSLMWESNVNKNNNLC